MSKRKYKAKRRLPMTEPKGPALPMDLHEQLPPNKPVFTAEQWRKALIKCWSRPIQDGIDVEWAGTVNRALKKWTMKA